MTNLLLRVSGECASLPVIDKVGLAIIGLLLCGFLYTAYRIVKET